MFGGHITSEKKSKQTKLILYVPATCSVLASLFHSCTLPFHGLVAAGLFLMCFCSGLLHMSIDPALNCSSFCSLTQCFQFLQSSFSTHITPFTPHTCSSGDSSDLRAPASPSLGWGCRRGGEGAELPCSWGFLEPVAISVLRGEAGPSFTFILGFSACVLTHSP